MLTRVFIGLGSNLGDREKMLSDAVIMLQEDGAVHVKKRSSVAETEPVDFLSQPDFLNQIIEAETDLDPETLYSRCREIESKLGRVRTFEKGPREIDLDILLYGNQEYNSGNLTIPHIGIMKRRFILDHLVELDPDLIDPVSKMKYSEVIRNEFCKKHQ